MALTKIVASRSGHRTTLIPFSGIVDDGSTLSLDFTTGQLDPRLTFTRSTNATFINSSGQVEWAASNMFSNSAWNDATATPSGWLAYGLSATATVAIAADPEARTIAVTTGAGNQPFLHTAPTVSQGLVYTASVEIVSITHGSGGTGEEIQFNQVLTAPYATSFNYYFNGSLISTPGSKITQTGVLTLVYTAGSQSQIRIGFGNSARNNCSVTVKAPQHQPGDVRTRTSFFRRTAADGAYYAPRFDYDPTSIGTPRGLLIEGAATNELQRSNEFNTSPWYTTNFNTPTIASPAVTDPANGTNTWYCVPSGAGSVIHGFRYNTAFTAVAYTFSIWAKAAQHDKFIISDGSSGQGACRFDLTAKTANVIAGVVTPTNPQIVEYPNGWFRCSFTMVMAAATRGITYSSYPTGASLGAFGATFTATGTDGMYFYGAQTELGSGASSYIPTGASTGSRAADNCVTAIGNLTGFNANQGTIYESWRDNTASDGISVPIPVQEWAFAFGTSGANGCGVFVSNAASGTFGLSGGISNTGDAGPAGTYVIQGVNKAAIAINVATTSLRLSANGSAVSAGTNIAGYNGAQTFALGQRNNNTRYLNGWISQFKYWPYVLPDAQLTTLTTL